MLNPREAADAAWVAKRFTDREAEDDPARPNRHDGAAAMVAIEVHDAGDIDVSKIPPRGWLLGVSFCRKFISGMVAEGGGGKTAVRYTQYLAVAAGKSLTGEHVHVRSRVLIVCLEDDLDEVRRRIGAAMLHHGIASAQIKGWLHYCTPRGLKLLQQVSAHGDSAVATGALHGELRRIIKELRTDLVSIDPFVKAHGVPENDNNLIDQVCTKLGELGDEFDVAIDLVSHARKGTTNPGDADRDRGASSKRDAGRLMRTLTAMTIDEAELYGVAEKDRRDFVRVDDAKVNITRRSAAAMWFCLVGVPLGNGNDLYPSGDEVQTVARWYPPDTFAKLDTATVDRILNKIEAGPYASGRFSPSPNATDRAAWPVVREFCPEASEKEAKHVITTWLKNGVLVKRDHKDPKDSHDHPSLFAGKRPGNTWEA
jgi:hypothetical protein